MNTVIETMAETVTQTMAETVAETMAETMTARITRYLLARIHRLAVLDLYNSAARLQLLEAENIGGNREEGTIWQVSPDMLALLTGDRKRDLQRIGRLLKRTRSVSSTDVTDSIMDVIHRSDDPEPYGLRHWVAEPGHDASPRTPEHIRHRLQISAMVLPMLRTFLPPPEVIKVAVALLVARAAGRVADMAVLGQALRRPDPYILIRVPVRGFERRFGLALEEGLIAPFWANLIDVFGGTALSEAYGEQRKAKVRRKIVTGSGKALAQTTDPQIRRGIGNILAASTPMPLVVADETLAALTSGVVDTADLVLEGQAIDPDILAQLLSICAGIPVQQSLAAMRDTGFDPFGLGLDDLAMAIRPDRSLDAILSVLTMLANEYPGSEDDEEIGKESRADRSGKRSVSKAGATPAVEIVRPERTAPEAEPEPKPKAKIDPRPEPKPERSALTGLTKPETTDKSAPRKKAVLRIETLSGYGDAKSWALNLRDDIGLWRNGQLSWDEMSTKLLLSGPPGTGKTTYARALCNTLGVPMIVSSVTSWLEPGYLGDVLQRMSAAFETARAHAPSILFIDEIDGIGRRGGGGGSGKAYDDYWTSLINRLLELLDGTFKSDGVIVLSATNLPDRIDPALLRSGRLERHITLPLPDAEALTGILQHHLGADLDTVLASAPQAELPQRLAATTRPMKPAAQPLHRTSRTKKGQVQ